MKLKFWIVAALAPLTSVMLLAQDTSPASAAAVSAPAAPRKRASPIRKKVILDPPAPATINAANVNVRGRASFTGEILGHLQKGDSVTVLARITLSRTMKDEPADWVEIAMPTSIPVWIDGDLIHSDTKTIKPRRVNLRGGPGENYSVLGRLDKGAVVKEIKTERGWVAIEPPTNAYAFVAAELVETQPPPAVVVTAPVPTPTPTPTPAPPQQVVNVSTPEQPAVATPTAPEPAPGPQKSETQAELDALHRATAAEPAPSPKPAPTPTPDLTPALSETNGPVKPRIVTREGFVRRAYNIQAPTDFELHEVQSGRLIDYLQPKPGQNFKIFVGTRITVTGPEALDPRWPKTPVLEVQSVDLVP